MEKIKGFFMEAALFLCLIWIWVVAGLDVLDD